MHDNLYKLTININNMQQDGVGKTIDKYRIKEVIEARDNGIGLLKAINITNNE